MTMVAPVAQWIEHRFPEPGAQVRVLSGVPFISNTNRGIVAESSVERSRFDSNRDSNPTDCSKPLSLKSRRLEEANAKASDSLWGSAVAISGLM